MAKTKVLNSFSVTAKLICVFVFAYAENRFSHDAAQILMQFLIAKKLKKVNLKKTLKEKNYTYVIFNTFRNILTCTISIF